MTQDTLNAEEYFQSLKEDAGTCMGEQFYSAHYVMEGDRIGFSNFADEDGWMLAYTFNSVATGTKRNTLFVAAEEFRARYAEHQIEDSFAKPLPEGAEVRRISVGNRYEALDPLSGLLVEKNADEPGYIVTTPGEDPRFYYTLDFHVLFRDHGQGDTVDPPMRVRVAQSDPDAKFAKYVVLDRDAEVDTGFNGILTAKAGDVLVRHRENCFVVEPREIFVTSYQVMHKFDDSRPEREARQKMLDRVRARCFKKLGGVSR